MKKCPICKRFMSEAKPCEYCKKSKPEFSTLKSLDDPNKLTVTAEKINLIANDRVIMNKELADIQDLKSAFISHCKTLGCEDNYIKVCENKFNRIEASITIQKKMVESLQSSKEHLIDDLEEALADNKVILKEKERLERENFELSEMVGFNATYKDEEENTSKQLKALEIIKDKKVDVPYIIENPEEKDVIWYNARFMGVLCEG